MSIGTTSGKATRIDLFSFATPQMRAFHLTWMAFFVCFFAWFATAPLMPIIKGDLKLTNDQVYNITIAGVFATILARMVIGPMCDRYGPRITYTLLLALGSIPVFGIAFAWDYSSFLVFRLLIGIIGASFVITQFHTSVMFAPNVVGTANATVGGWGNAGGGVTQSLMPLVVAGIVGYGASQATGWRYAMILPGLLMLVVAVLYWTLTQDTPQGNILELRRQGITVDSGKKGRMGRHEDGLPQLPRLAPGGVLRRVLRRRALRPQHRGHVFLQQVPADGGERRIRGRGFRSAGALRARPRRSPVRSHRRVQGGSMGAPGCCSGLMLGEGIFLIFFSQSNEVAIAITFLLVFGLFTHMACGSLYALVPFIDRKALGGVAGHHRSGRQYRRRRRGLPVAGDRKRPAMLLHPRMRGDRVRLRRCHHSLLAGAQAIRAGALRRGRCATPRLDARRGHPRHRVTVTRVSVTRTPRPCLEERLLDGRR